jgi:hypothetical protein
MSVTACGREVSSTQKESQAVARQLSVFSKGQPVPAFSYSFERDLMIQLYRLRNEKVATHTVWRSDYGMIEGDTPSIGYGLPYDVSLTNPLQLDHKRVKGYGSHTTLEGTVEQQEPNGTYASKNTTATWVMSVDSDTGQMVPIYIEGKVTVYPYPVTVDYNTNRVYKAGKASTTISIDNANDFMQIR